MKKIKIITLLAIGLSLANCKKDESPTATSSRASTDIATDISGTWIASSGSGQWYDAFGTNQITVVSKIQITKISSDKVSISSPSGLFTSFTVDKLIVAGTGYPGYKYRSLEFPASFYIFENGFQLVISQLRPIPSDIYKHLTFIGYKQ